jgi:hypothetical protein
MIMNSIFDIILKIFYRLSRNQESE